MKSLFTLVMITILSGCTTVDSVRHTLLNGDVIEVTTAQPSSDARVTMVNRFTPIYDAEGKVIGHKEDRSLYMAEFGSTTEREVAVNATPAAFLGTAQVMSARELSNDCYGSGCGNNININAEGGNAEGGDANAAAEALAAAKAKAKGGSIKNHTGVSIGPLFEDGCPTGKCPGDRPHREHDRR